MTTELRSEGEVPKAGRSTSWAEGPASRKTSRQVRSAYLGVDSAVSWPEERARLRSQEAVKESVGFPPDLIRSPWGRREFEQRVK